MQKKEMWQYLGSKVDVDPQRLQHIGAAARRRARPAPLLHDEQRPGISARTGLRGI
jgi:hypothetical protein